MIPIGKGVFRRIIFCLTASALFNANADDTILATVPSKLIQLFNGHDFSGWTFCMRNGAAPEQTWTITNGIVHCTGAAIGYMRTIQNFRDYQLTVEWRFVKMAPKMDNTGILFHIQPPDKVWPMCVQVQGKSTRQGDLFVMSGTECKEHLGQDANAPVSMHGDSNEKAVGEWNSSVTVCSSNKVTAVINGKQMNEITECTISSGCIGFQSEGADFEIRKVTLEPLPK